MAAILLDGAAIVAQRGGYVQPLSGRLQVNDKAVDRKERKERKERRRGKKTTTHTGLIRGMAVDQVLVSLCALCVLCGSQALPWLAGVPYVNVNGRP
jgi:hypothetical protein